MIRLRIHSENQNSISDFLFDSEGTTFVPRFDGEKNDWHVTDAGENFQLEITTPAVMEPSKLEIILYPSIAGSSAGTYQGELVGRLQVTAFTTKVYSDARD